MRSLVVRVFTGCVLLAGSAMQALACPACKEGFKPGTAEAAAGSAFSMSVMFMLAVPTLIVTSFTIVLVRRMKKVERGEV